MKKENILIIFLSGLIILLSIIVFLIFNKKEPVENEPVNLDINSKLVHDLYSMANPSEDAILLDELYNNEKLTDKYKIAMGIANYLKYNEPIEIKHQENSYGPESYIPEEDVHNNIKNILGDVEYKDQDVFIINENICGYKYNEELKRYEDGGGCGGNFWAKYYRKIDSAYIQDNKIFIKEKMFYATFDFDEFSNKISVFSNSDMQKNLYYIEVGPYDNPIKLEDYIDKGSIYEYEFEKIDNNNNYIFKGIKRIS